MNNMLDPGTIGESFNVAACVRQLSKIIIKYFNVYEQLMLKVQMKKCSSPFPFLSTPSFQKSDSIPLVSNFPTI